MHYMFPSPFLCVAVKGRAEYQVILLYFHSS